jgi:hypothetical protein
LLPNVAIENNFMATNLSRFQNESLTGVDADRTPSLFQKPVGIISALKHAQNIYNSLVETKRQKD